MTNNTRELHYCPDCPEYFYSLTDEKIPEHDDSKWGYKCSGAGKLPSSTTVNTFQMRSSSGRDWIF